MTKYLVIEGTYNGADAKVYDTREEAEKALEIAYTYAMAETDRPLEDFYLNCSNALIKTDQVEDLWHGTIKEINI